MSDTLKLSDARKGARGVIVKVGDHCHHADHAVELERRLLELGFVEARGSNCCTKASSAGTLSP